MNKLGTEHQNIFVVSFNILCNYLLVETENNQEIIIKDSRSAGREFKPGSPEHEAGHSTSAQSSHFLIKVPHIWNWKHWLLVLSITFTRLHTIYIIEWETGCESWLEKGVEGSDYGLFYTEWYKENTNELNFMCTRNTQGHVKANTWNRLSPKQRQLQQYQ